ncbi:putative ribonuclease H-like domain-containing protein [Tanacetum coccineum]
MLNNIRRRVTGQRELDLWNNAPAGLTKSGNVPVNTAKKSSPRAAVSNSTARYGNPQYALQDQGIFDSGCSRHMTRNKSYLTDYQDIDGGFVAFAGSPKGGKITGKGKIRTGKLDFEDVYFVKELKFNIFSISQMCDKKNSVLFTETECLVLSPNFKLLDESQVLLKVPRQNNMYSFDLKNVVPSGGIKREFSVARTPQQNGVAERKNRTIIEAARTMHYLLHFRLKQLILLVIYCKEIKTNIMPGIETNLMQEQLDIEKASDNEYMTMLPTRLHAFLNLNSLQYLEAHKEGYANSTNRDSTTSPSVSTVGPSINTASENINTASPIPNDSSMQSLENTGIFNDAYDDSEVGAEADLNNLETTMNVSPIPTSRIHKDHPIDQIIGDINSATQTRRMTKISEEHAMNPRRQRLVAQGYTQEEGIDYDEVFAPVARIEAIRLFLAYASFMGFIVYQMDVKSAFLYGTIEEEVYVCQPPGFEDPQFPDKVYKVEKALYGLHQAPRAWYETLSTYLLENGFRRGTIDKTLFIKKDRGDILLVQVYVDDIIFGSTKKSLCVEFEQMMHKRFQMSSIGELTFFLGLQVQQKEDGIFISQDKYVADILKKFDFVTVKTTSTPMEPNKALVKDEEAEDVDVHLYRSMIGSLMYLTASRPDIMFAICACARFQITPKTSHIHAVKRIFRYLKCQPKLGLWYPKDSPFDIRGFSNE